MVIKERIEAKQVTLIKSKSEGRSFREGKSNNMTGMMRMEKMKSEKYQEEIMPKKK